MRAVSKICIVVSFFVMVFAACAFGTTRYIATSAGTFSGGTACNGQTTITPSTWNATTNSAGDINYICGTITIPTGATGLTAKGSGTSGSLISLIFDAGAVLQSVSFGGSPGGSVGGGIVFNNVSYWTVDGQNTGIIQNIGNGSPGQTTCLSGCTVNQNSVGLWISNAIGITVQSLTIRNIYMDLNGAGSWSDAGYTADVWVGGPSSSIVIKSSTLNDAHTGIWAGFDNGNLTGFTIANNAIAHHAWCVSWANGTASSSTTSTGSIYGNSIGNFNDWNLSGNSGWHTDGIITYTYNTVTFNPVIYNNNFYGDLDGGTGAGTAHISVGTNYGAVSSGTGTGTVFNNVIDMTGNTHCAAALWDQGVGVRFYNNTIVGPPTCSTGSSIGLVISGDSASLENNIFSTLRSMIGGYGSAATDLTTSNRNVFYNCMSSSCFGFGDGSGPNYSSLAAYKTGTGQDAESVSTNPNLVNFVPQSGSPGVGLGINLTSMGITALDSDKAGVTRPSSAAWDAGAYQDPPNGINPPTALSATVN